MQTIPISEIQIGERIRKNFSEEKISDLASSILRKGLFHAPVLQDDKHTLVMGENRIRAIWEIYNNSQGPIYFNGEPVPYGEVPFNTLSDMDEDDLIEAELEENILRDDLTWQERATATKRLHELRVSQYGEYKPKGGGGGEGWSVTDTAKEVHPSNHPVAARGKVQDDLILAEHIDDPDVQKARDEKEARKIIDRKAKEKKRQEQAAKFKQKATPHSLVYGDSFDRMVEFSNESFDIILTDPPYGIDVHKDKQRDGEYHEYDDSEEYLDKVANFLAEEGYRITKPQAHLYMFCDIRQWPHLRSIFWLAGWEVWERPLIWYKGNTGSFGGTDWGPRRTYEAVLYAAKGRRPVTALYHDVINIPKPTQTEHPAAKPPEVYMDLLRRSANPGDAVLDPFCGGGPIFPAADKLACVATGIELHDDYHAIAAATLEEIDNGASLADLVEG